MTSGEPRWRIGPLAAAEEERVGAVLGLARLGQGGGFYLVAWEGEEPLGHAYLALTDPPELQDVAVRESIATGASPRPSPPPPSRRRSRADSTGSASRSASTTHPRRRSTAASATSTPTFRRSACAERS